MSRNAKLLLQHGWLWVSEKRNGCIHNVYWRDPLTKGVVQQRSALILLRKRTSHV